MNADQTITDTRDMALTHGDFFRILPRAMGEHVYSVEASRVTATLGEGSLTIDIGPQQLRKIALMEVPWCRIDFTARGVSRAEFDAFAQHFHRRFQRGGG